MALLLVQRVAMRDLFSAAAKMVKIELDREQINIEEVKRFWKRVEDRFLSLNKIDEEVMDHLRENDVSQEEMNNELQIVQEYRDVWSDMNSAIDNILEQGSFERGGSSYQRTEEKSRYKLPKLKLVEFDGCPKQWLNFWSQFKGIDEDKYLSSEEKFQYLIQSTTKDSDAHRVVSSFPPTADNYKKAISHLKSRFGKDKVLVEVYVRDLLKLVLSNASGVQKFSLAKLYDQLETQLRALESLGVTTDKYAAMLYPLVESSLSEDVLRTWERMRNQRTNTNEDTEDQLQQLMNFLRNEVESDVRLKMAKRSIMYDDDDEVLTPQRKIQRVIFEPISTTDLLNRESYIRCVFCSGKHASQDCITAQRLSVDRRLDKIKEAKKCFKCLKGNHLARVCQAVVSCKACKKPHYEILCRQTQLVKPPVREIKNSSTYFGGFVVLQTLVLKVETENTTLLVRVLIDSGSERSYVTKSLVETLGRKPNGFIGVNHCLFGGLITNETKHGIYSIEVKHIQEESKMRLELLDVERICGYVSSIPEGPWVKELQDQGIVLSDKEEHYGEINMLFGADVASQLYTGKICPTNEGPVAFETKLGWTLMGKIGKSLPKTNYTLFAHSLHISNAKIEDLWKLDLIGIMDPIINKNREDIVKSTLEHFKKNVCRQENGRYEVRLPWIEDNVSVGNNKDIAIKRLQSTWTKLEKMNMVNEYQQIFEEWLELGIIEEILNDDVFETVVSYLPHHPVFNPKSTTTPIRPVFDASARSKGFPSLNNCLEKGPNMIELILDILIRFRMGKYAILADVKKAFLQISVAKQDRNFLRFLWYKDGKIRTFRHCRVVFGLKCSPFLLAATLNHHLDNSDIKFKETAELLKSSTYVDNVVASVNTEVEMKRFIVEAAQVCSEGKFELRNWVWNTEESGIRDDTMNIKKERSTIVSVLGLLWDVEEDTLSLDLRKFLMHTNDNVTKRSILAATHRVYDPIGLVSPVTIVPRMMLQELFKKKIKWDEPVTADIERQFKQWIRDAADLQLIKIPRWVLSSGDNNKKTIHIFTDASKGAYTAVAFLRTENNDTVNVQFLMAKARVSTIKPITIPKLELIGCEIGAKLYSYLTNTLQLVDIKAIFWSDSSNALSWIKRNENWQLFVQNRVKKIQELTNSNDWRHIPGEINPADLPSRGCTARQLLSSRWWEGPNWLKQSEEYWPKSVITCNEEVVMAEKRRMVMSHKTQVLESSRYFHRFHNFRKVVRVIAWMRRWKSYKRSQKRAIELDMEEEREAEICLWKLVQSETIEGNQKILTQFKAIKDAEGLWRVKSRLTMRPDSEDFKYPILLPKDHVAVNCLIQKEHLDNHHIGTQALRCLLRERFWIINSRVATRRAVHKCGRCKRFGAKRFTAPEPPLPLNRVRDARIFEIVGIDLGGPLILKNNTKVWFVIFTCAVYRAVHLELVTSLSTEGFIQALRRFIARRGRPDVFYTDNGTNFIGTNNLMNQLDWDEISKTSTASRIKWIFNPPRAPWWGGWWERLVGIVKKLLRCNLGRQTLNYIEMETILCDCEAVINSRPLTYLTEDPDELVALTPMMFLNDARSSEVVDLDQIEYFAFGERYKHRQVVRQELRERFRKEYLAQLIHRNVRQCGHNQIKIGDIVLVEVENQKRIEWPIAKVIELFPSIDGIVRSVKLSLKGKEFIRAIQRLYLLESSASDLGILAKDENSCNIKNIKARQVEPTEMEEKDVDMGNDMDEQVKTTRHGRIVKKPDRYRN